MIILLKIGRSFDFGRGVNMGNNLRNQLAFCVATVCSVGYTPGVPGTVGSVVAAFLFYISPDMHVGLRIGLWFLLFFIGVWAAGVTERELHVKDASCIVIDELIGMGIAVFMLPKTWEWYVAALLLFRFFVFAKVFPIGSVERTVPGGWGIVLDDVVAGIMSCICLHTTHFFIVNFLPCSIG